MKILGIESSHDDTSIALVENFNVIFNYKISQTEIHKKFGGTVPEIASREHYSNFYILLNEILKDYEFKLSTIDAIAYTKEPGLIGPLQMGYLFAHALSISLNKPLIPINHLEGHIASVLLNSSNKIIYPAIALVVSGGHSNIYLFKNEKEKELIGQTLDDALGEVFDKVARTLDLGFPGGPIIDQKYFENLDKDLKTYKFNKPKLSNEACFSFSGYKTQVINMIKKVKNINNDLLAACFEKQVIDYVIETVEKTIHIFKPKTLILSGGVSANQYLREQMCEIHENVLIPNLEFSTDNGAMIAAAALLEMKKRT